MSFRTGAFVFPMDRRRGSDETTVLPRDRFALHRAKPQAQQRFLQIVDGLVVDVDDAGNPVGIDIDHASTKVHLKTLETVALPAS